MKTTHKYTGVLLFMLLLLWMASCNDFLTENPKGRLATETFFNKKTTFTTGRPLHWSNERAGDVKKTQS